MRVTETHKRTEKRIYVLLPGSKGVETTFHLWSVWHLIACAWRGLPGCVCMCVLCGVSLWLPWDRVRDCLLSGEEGRACDRLQWLVELSGQNMSDSADSMNHFGLQLCNLSPTLHHITASMWLLHARLKRSRLSRLAFLFGPPVARSIWSTDWWDATKLRLLDKAFFYRKETQWFKYTTITAYFS